MRAPMGALVYVHEIDTRARMLRFRQSSGEVNGGRDDFAFVARCTLAPLTKAERIAEARKASAEKVREWRDAIAHACLRDNIDHAFHEGERLAAEIAKIQAE